MRETAAQTPLFAPLPPQARERADGAIALEVLTSAEAFAALAPDWNRLHAASPGASVFNSWIWQYQWWQIYGGSHPLRIFVARIEGRIAGIAAFYLQQVRMLGLRVRVLRFVGTGGDTNPDDLGPVLVPERQESLALELARGALGIDGADVVIASDIDPESVFARALERARLDLGRAALAAPCERIAFIELPASWSKFLASLNSDRRTRLKSARRKAERAHALRFFVWDDAATLDAAVDRLAKLHRMRWSAAGGSDSFGTPEYVEFHRRIINSCFARGWLRLYCLELDGEIAAITYCYRFRNRVYLMQAGFDPARAACNPGKVLLGYALEHAIGEGNEVFDFLRGEHRYKDQLASGHRRTACIRVFRASPAALAYRLRRIWLPLLKARLERRPAPKLKL